MFSSPSCSNAFNVWKEQGSFLGTALANPLPTNTWPSEYVPVAFPGILFGLGGSTNSVEDRERGLGVVAPYPPVKGSGGSCNLVQEISLHIVKVSSFLAF